MTATASDRSFAAMIPVTCSARENGEIVIQQVRGGHQVLIVVGPLKAAVKQANGQSAIESNGKRRQSTSVEPAKNGTKE